ncbi:uncharacterized protein PFL1_00765 [Pseudozyma flocculosa PF-1]|uniref:WLM domain-containing protein n=1 Tax=Pseudozyma flocculosa TaxID=84751 RepID=A0A5C3F5T5_9BASI|nr:uncharacterized protein PFL1_00765 [Pseudozyma flocculosa PF-1]EPQ31430.1 hypothetical protein PFL1_00765 [Pseudozyma flocculosa PF-1]SPO38789.1 uncharacterized protein PSFLO_04268 [Pseudozyma flocculosa]
MVHLRLNDPDTSRNEHINYITALPHFPDHEEARRRLCQLAAQVKPVMKNHGFQINSLEEFEWNREFAGRNWNAGENVELVLRRQDGSFAPLQWVLMVFCHELAHIKHMNHVPSLHGKLDRELKQECKDLQSRGYFGDGFWSAGQRLFDNVVVSGAGMNQLEGLPQYSCGGAYRRQTKRKRTGTGAGSKRKRRGFKGPSLHTGAQTAANTKGGRRLNRELPGQGSRVDSLNFIPTASATSKSYKDDPNSTFRKRATSHQARELRAEAAMRRLGLGRFKAEPTAEERDDKKDEKKPKLETAATTTTATRTAGQSTLDGFLPHPSPADAGDDSETETEEEPDRDPNDGFLILDGGGSGAGEGDDDSDETETEPELDGAAAAAGSSQGKVKREAETQASGETDAQRRERARLYRQHERAQGANVRLKTTSEEWSEWFQVVQDQPRSGDIQAGAEEEEAHGGSGNAGSSRPTAEQRTAPPSPAAPVVVDDTKQVTAVAAAPIKVKAEDAIAISDSDEEDRGEIAPPGLGSRLAPAASPSLGVSAGRSSTAKAPMPAAAPAPRQQTGESGAQVWQCRICTLLNPLVAQRCEACDTSRGSTLLGQ